MHLFFRNSIDIFPAMCPPIVLVNPPSPKGDTPCLASIFFLSPLMLRKCEFFSSPHSPAMTFPLRAKQSTFYDFA